MSFGGSAADMLYKMKYNSSLRVNNRNNYNKYKNTLVTYKKSVLKSEHIKISNEERESIKNKFKRKLVIQNTIAIISTIFSVLVMLIIIIYLMKNYLFR